MPTRDLVIAVAITGTLIIATVATAAVGAVPRIGSAILDLGLLGLAGRRQKPLPAAVATVVVVITSVLTAPEAIKLPIVAAVALVAYTLARYESGLRLVAGFVVSVGGVVVARLLFPEGHAHGVTIVQLVVLVVLLPALSAALMRVRGWLPGLLGPDAVADGVPELVTEGRRAAESVGPGELPAGLGRIWLWVEFVFANRNRLLYAIAGALVALVPLLHGVGTGALGRDIVVIGLAVIGVGSVGLIGRWPLPALLITLVAAVSLAGAAPRLDTYDSVIGGVVVIGLPLIVGLLLRRTPGLIALGACGAAISVMGLVARAGTLPSVGTTTTTTTTSSQLLSSLALAVGAWSTGRVLRRGGWVAEIDAAAPVPAARAKSSAARTPRLYPDAAELVERAELLGLRPTTIRVDHLHDRLSDQFGSVVREVLDEALDNAARHAPGADLAVKVLHEKSVISIEVISGRALGEREQVSGAGRGIPELAERISEVGGMFGVGPASGGFALRARLPVTKADDLDSGDDQVVVQVADRDQGAEQVADQVVDRADDHRIGLDASPMKVPAGVDTD